MEHIKKIFEECTKKFGMVEWEGVKLVLTQDPYPFGPVEDWFFTATAMDKHGNLWDVIWYPKPDALNYDDYADQVEDWNKPDFAEIVYPGYFI